MSDPSRVRFPWHRSAVRVLTTVVAMAASLVVISTVVYLASGEVSRVDDAIFESVAGFTTTSLTVVDPEGGLFSVALIPHTLQVTTLGERREGDAVNLEVDVLGKYVHRYLEQRQSAL